MGRCMVENCEQRLHPTAEICVLQAFPRESKALKLEAGEAPHQSALAKINSTAMLSS